MPKPVAPPAGASKAAHKKHAEEVLDYEPYKVKPQDMPDEDEVPDKHQGGPGEAEP